MRVPAKVLLIASVLVASALYLVGRRRALAGLHTLAESPTRHVWFTFTKAGVNSPLGLKLESMLDGLVGHSTGVRLHLNVIGDANSKPAAAIIIDRIVKHHYPDRTSHRPTTSFYDVDECAERLSDIVDCMTPHFSSTPGSYYSDALFYLSLGIHRIAPLEQNEIVLLDCDLSFESSIEELFEEFERFSSTNLIGLGYELSPVYRHVLHSYRTKNKFTPFGSELNFYKKLKNISLKENLPNHKISPKLISGKLYDKISIDELKYVKGFPGFNSGVILLNLKRIRESQFFEDLLKCDYVKNVTKKYIFRGHLGDQDFFTILGHERPELFYFLDCSWNRQLCKWWRQYVENEVFDDYYKCDSPIRIYHGNCNTPIPTLN